ncbi:MAG: MSMEG_0570 family nitrogen starvation response protein [Xanthobacteraceae bacterium]|nr:MSMEG_0570 family nitrogen starvation response protein [Xanthobacteraceae bacterium]
MPEMHFDVRWPDGATETCYSPSLVIKDHLAVGECYALEDFLARGRVALTIASDRVREKYGFACSRALGQLARIEAAARRFADDPNARVTVLAFHD